MRITDVKIFVVKVGLRSPIAPYVWARGEIRETTSSVIMEVCTDEGLVGWGETYISRISDVSASLIMSLPSGALCLAEEIGRMLREEEPGRINLIIELMRRRGIPDILIAGLEMALWDLLGKSTGRPLCELLGGQVRSKIPLCACVGIQEPRMLARIAEELIGQGFTTIKVKAGRDPDEDVKTAQTVRDVAGQQIKLRLDANGNYWPDVFRRLSRRLEAYYLQYFEQPCRVEALEEMALLRRVTTTPIALNESLVTAKDMLRIVALKAADVGVAEFWGGGISEVRKIAAIAEAAGIPLAMHCAMDLGIKTAAMLHVASAMPVFAYASDSTYYAQEGDILDAPLQIVDGHMEIPQGPGLGIEVDRALLTRYAI